MDSFLNTQLLLCPNQQEWCRMYLPCLLWLSSILFFSNYFSRANFWKDSSRVVGNSLAGRALHYGILIVSCKCYPMDIPRIIARSYRPLRFPSSLSCVSAFALAMILHSQQREFPLSLSERGMRRQF